VHIHESSEEAATTLTTFFLFNVLDISHCRCWSSPKRRHTSHL
jgi:hypothetical protein